MGDLLFDWFGFSCFVDLNYQQIYVFGQIQTSQIGGQPYSDSSPYEVSECSLPTVTTIKRGQLKLIF